MSKARIINGGTPGKRLLAMVSGAINTHADKIFTFLMGMFVGELMAVLVMRWVVMGGW